MDKPRRAPCNTTEHKIRRTKGIVYQDLIDAVRDDPQVGRGTCSYIDEAFDDRELLDRLAAEDIMTPEAAVKMCRELNALLQEQCDERSQIW